MHFQCFIYSFLLTILISSTSASPFHSSNPAQVFGRQADTSPLFNCAATSWPTSSIGQPNTAVEPSSDLKSILSQVSSANIEATILQLVTYGTRHTLSPQNNATYGIGGARDWIKSQFQKYADASDGRLTVDIESYIQGPDGNRIPFAVNISDVVATLKGTETPERVYVVSGHYDSRCTDPNDYTSAAPGADDDASGVAISLELARIMSQPQYPRPKATIKFVAVAGEEQNLYGSRYLAQTYQNATPPVNVEAMFTNDIVGSPKADNGVIDPYTIRLFAQGLPPLTVENSTRRETRLTIGGENDTPSRNLARFALEVGSNPYTAMNISVIYRLDRYLRGGDHRPFLEAGYPAARYTEPHENFAHQHQDVRFDNKTGIQYGDLPQFCDYEYIARVGRVNAAVMYSLAASPGMPRNVRVNTTVLSNDSTFYWDPPAGGEDGNVAGYEVVWRATDAPFWTDVLDVGRVRGVTVGVSKDNVVFGVRARGLNGERGVAVLPFPVS